MSRTIAVLNPNSTQSVTDALSECLEPLRFPGGPAIRCATLAEGPPAIETDEQVAAVAAPVCGYVRAHQDDTSAFVIACFSDPGLEQARTQSARPVFGMAQCGLLTALAYGRRFGVVSILETSLARHLRYIRALGIESRLAGDLPLGLGVLQLEDHAVTLDRMCSVGARLRDERGADVIVMGCAGLAALRGPLEDSLGVPVIEPVQAAVGMAMAAVALGSSRVAARIRGIGATGAARE
jgi:Asp/Glu/hydantoin racemase